MLSNSSRSKATRLFPGGLSRRQAGFSLIELLVTMVILVEVTVGILLLFDRSNQLARSQSFIAEMQQQQRVAQSEITKLLRQAGSGGIPLSLDPVAMSVGGLDPDDITWGYMPDGLGVSVLNNVAAGGAVSTDAGGPTLEGGTDVLTVRGVFDTPMYFIETRPITQAEVDGGSISFTVLETLPSGFSENQDLDPLAEALLDAQTAGTPEAFVVVSGTNSNFYSVMELVPGSVAVNANNVQFNLRLVGATNLQAYGNLGRGGGAQFGTSPQVGLGTGPSVAVPQSVAAIAMVSEYRFFIREEYEIAGDDTTRATPVLSRGRFLPGTDTLHPEGVVDIAANIFDLQVAMAIDTNGDDRIAEGDTPAARQADEVLYNQTGDEDYIADPPAVPEPQGIGGSEWASANSNLHFIRINTLAMADRPDISVAALSLGAIEDRTNWSFNPEQLGLRVRRLETVVNIRSAQ